jgi:hypothetical protein
MVEGNNKDKVSMLWTIKREGGREEDNGKCKIPSPDWRVLGP